MDILYLRKVLQPQNENKTFQKLIPILAIVNHRNCLVASPLLHLRILNIEKILNILNLDFLVELSYNQLPLIGLHLFSE